MSETFTVSGFEITDDLQKYAHRKVLYLSRRIPRALRAQAACTIHFSQVMRNNVKRNTCTVTLSVEQHRYRAKETTAHMYAALDVVMVRVERELRESIRVRQRRGLSRLLRPKL